MIERLLVIRLSAMGDVAMTVPVIAELAIANPNIKITVLSRDFLRPLFEKLPDNVDFIGFDPKQKHSSFKGLNMLFKELKAKKFDAVADLHDVIRTKYLRLRFSLRGVKVVHIDKGRAEKKALVKHEIHTQLTPTIERYRTVFRNLGLNVGGAGFTSIFNGGKADLQPIAELLKIDSSKRANEAWIGVAPFAAHKGKAYPVESMRACVEMLAAKSGNRVFCFGAGPSETAVLQQWEAQNVHCVAGKMRLKQELELMSNLDVMVSMDSANMHLASLVSVPVVSIWGATHPFAGFMGYKQSEDNAVQLDLPCRPCSIYGNKPCTNGQQFECMSIPPKIVVDRVEKVIDQNRVR